MKYLLCLVLTGCAADFKGGATSDYRPAPAKVDTVIVNGGVKTPCEAKSVKIGKITELNC